VGFCGPRADEPPIAVGALLALGFALGCGSDPAPSTPDASIPDAGSSADASGCSPGEVPLDGGGCRAAGLPPSTCAAGEAEVGGGCLAAGVPTDACGRGFAPDGAQGCEPVLPSQPCAKGQIAQLGETACHDVAPCGAAPWGSIPTDATTQYVDAAYGQADSDGTAAKPWTTIGAGILAAMPGAVIAVAAGSYKEDVAIAGKPVRLWGRCPGLVEIVGTGGALAIGAGAAGTEVHDLALTGDGWAGCEISGADDVLLDRVWMHDTTGARGIEVDNDLGPTAATITRSLIEWTSLTAVNVWGATATLESTVVRDAQNLGRGINIAVHAGVTATATVRSCIIERNGEDGVAVFGSDLTLERSLVRDTQADPSSQGAGFGLYVTQDRGAPASATVRDSVLEHNAFIGIGALGAVVTVERSVVRDTLARPSDLAYGRGLSMQDRSTLAMTSCLVDANRETGIVVNDSDATIASSIVRGTQPQASDSTNGSGITVRNEPTNPSTGGTLALVSSIVEDSRSFGVLVVGSEATIESSIVRATQLQASDGTLGNGILVQHDPESGRRSTASIAGSVVDQSREAGLFVLNSDVKVDATRVSGTVPGASPTFGDGILVLDDRVGGGRASLVLTSSLVEDNTSVGVVGAGADVTVEGTVVRGTRANAMGIGRGIGIEMDPETKAATHGTIRASLVEDNFEIGIGVLAADATIDGTLVRGTKARPTDGALGDGIVTMTYGAASRLYLTGSRIETSARAGLTSFAGKTDVGSTVFECNPIDLDGEPVGADAFSFADLGANVCGCAGETVACKVLSANLQPPQPVEQAPGP